MIFGRPKVKILLEQHQNLIMCVLVHYQKLKRLIDRETNITSLVEALIPLLTLNDVLFEWLPGGGIARNVIIRKPEVHHHNKNITAVAGAAAAATISFPSISGHINR